MDLRRNFLETFEEIPAEISGQTLGEIPRKKKQTIRECTRKFMRKSFNKFTYRRIFWKKKSEYVPQERHR